MFHCERKSAGYLMSFSIVPSLSSYWINEIWINLHGPRFVMIKLCEDFENYLISLKPQLTYVLVQEADLAAYQALALAMWWNVASPNVAS